MSVTSITGVMGVIHIVNASLAPETLTLPAISVANSGTMHSVKKIDNNNTNFVTIAPTGSDLIEDELELILPNRYESTTFIADNTNKMWWIVSEYKQ